MSDDPPGFQDTPPLPNCPYRVHDPERPYPERVDPAGPVTQAPPDDATVLFDGTDLAAWESVPDESVAGESAASESVAGGSVGGESGAVEDGDDPGWTVESGELVVEPGTGDIRTREPLGDCQLHVEWATPAEPGDAEYPGNSGVFLADRYEVQILDCAATSIYADGWCGAVYGQHPPLVDACLPSGAWQSYDIGWRRPRFEDGDLAEPGRVTVLHNGVVIHDATEPLGPTAYRDFLPYEPHGPAQLRLQDHGFRVRFRNVWYRPLGE